jgi:hypothetical protein
MIAGAFERGLKLGRKAKFLVELAGAGELPDAAAFVGFALTFSSFLLFSPSLTGMAVHVLTA